MAQLMDNVHKHPPRTMKPQQKRRPQQRFSKHQNNHQRGNPQNGRSLLAQRNTFQQNLERYLNLAREARSSGDRVLAENYFQYAEHYFRSLNEVKALIELENPKEEASNKDGEVAAEAEPTQEAGETESKNSEEAAEDQEALSA